MSTLAGRYSTVLSTLNKHNVQLIAVSKTFPQTDIRQLYTLGQLHFAENYVQEFAEKAQQLKDLTDIKWHFIGNIQSNKIKLISQYADWVHSLSSAKHAQLLHNNRSADQSKLNVLIEVNVTNETNKHGLTDLQQVLELAHFIAKQERLTLRGIMGMAGNTDNQEIITQQFAALKQIYTQLKEHHPDIDSLSMGMSNDYPLAIANGATMVRIGSLIFGNRNYTTK